MRWLFLLPVSLFFLQTMATAQNEFRCDEDWSEAECNEEKKLEAYWAEYGDRYDGWFDEMSFDTNLFFGNYRANRKDTDPTSNLVDARYSIALRRYSGWAFAINMVCADGKQEERRDAQNCSPEIRMLSLKPREELSKIDPALGLPKSREEMADFLSATMNWREASMQQCKGASKQLTQFAKIQSEFWHKNYLDWLSGKQPERSDVLLVTADGDNISIRARSKNDPFSEYVGPGRNLLTIDESNRGPNYDWAKKMVKIVEPCLKPSATKPPWAKVIEARSAVNGSTRPAPSSR